MSANRQEIERWKRESLTWEGDDHLWRNRFDALAARLAETEDWRLIAHARITDLEARETALRKALERIEAQQPKTLAMIESNGFVFDSIGREPGNWQHLAFTVYTDLCEIDLIARTALHEQDPA